MTRLPPVLAPWAAELALFPPEIATVIGHGLPRLVGLFPAQAPRDASGGGEPEGFDGLARRGLPERLLTTEWLYADEAPDEFLRRAVDGEQAYLRVARRAPPAARTSSVLLDAGPSQLGSPRVVQLAILVVLARRAAAAGASLRVAMIQGGWPAFPGITRPMVEAFLAARSIAEPDAAMLDRAIAAVGHHGIRDADGELWVVGGARAASLATTASVVCVDEPPSFTERVVTVEVRPRKKLARSAKLTLPPSPAVARILRDPFATRPAAVPDSASRADAEIVPGAIRLAPDGRAVFLRSRDGVLRLPVPNSPRAPVALPRHYRTHGRPLAVVGWGRRVASLAAHFPTGRMILETHGSSRRSVGLFTRHVGEARLLEPAFGDPFARLVVASNGAAWLVDGRGFLFELPLGKESHALLARDVRAIRLDEKLRWVGRLAAGVPGGREGDWVFAERSPSAAAATTTAVPDLSDARLGPRGRFAHRRADGPWILADGQARREIVVPERTHVLAIRGDGLLALSPSGREVVHHRPDGQETLFVAEGVLSRDEIDASADGDVVAYLVADGLLVVRPLARASASLRMRFKVHR